MKRLLLMFALGAMAIMTLAPTALAQGHDAEEDVFDCADFATQTGAQALLEPDNARTWAELAMVYYRVARAKTSQDMLADARKAANKAIEIDPNGYGKDVLALIEQADFKSGGKEPR